MKKIIAIAALLFAIITVTAVLPTSSQAFMSPIWTPFSCGGCSSGGLGYSTGWGNYGWGYPGSYGGGYYGSGYGVGAGVGGFSAGLGWGSPSYYAYGY